MANSAVSCGAVSWPARRMRADRRADAEVLPQSAGGEHDAEFEHRVDLDLRDDLVACRAGSGGIASSRTRLMLVDQPFEAARSS